MDKPIPPEIMLAAKTVVHQFYDSDRHMSLIDLVSIALMARDERAAGIAREASDECDGAEGWLTGTDIATAILAYDGASNAE